MAVATFDAPRPDAEEVEALMEGILLQLTDDVVARVAGMLALFPLADTVPWSVIEVSVRICFV